MRVIFIMLEPMLFITLILRSTHYYVRLVILTHSYITYSEPIAVMLIITS